MLFFAVVDDIFKYVSFAYVKLLLNKLQEKALDFFWKLETFVHEVRAWSFFLRYCISQCSFNSKRRIISCFFIFV